VQVLALVAIARWRRFRASERGQGCLRRRCRRAPFSLFLVPRSAILR